jgi:hypothetical protein
MVKIQRLIGTKDSDLVYTKNHRPTILFFWKKPPDRALQLTAKNFCPVGGTLAISHFKLWLIQLIY